MSIMRTRDHIRLCASLVVLLIDDFTGKVILDKSARVYIKGQKAPMSKPDGYFVFVNLPDDEVELLVEGGMYEQVSMMITPSSSEHKDRLIRRIRLTPGRGYPVPSDATRIEGTAEPLSQIRVLCRDGVGVFKLLYDYDNKGESGDKIFLFNPDKQDLDGRLLFIEDGENEQSEFFRIRQSTDNADEAILEEPLKHKYKKIGATIYPVFTAQADDEGAFFIPIAGLKEKECKIMCQSIGEKTNSLEVTIKTGTSQIIDLTQKAKKTKKAKE